MKEFKEELISWFRYLFWADLCYKRFQKLLDTSEDSQEINLYIAFSSQWYGSLYVVVEGWHVLKLEDQIISKLLAEHQDIKDFLKRYRNGVFHFQSKLLDNRFTGFGKAKDNSILWAMLLHGEFVRFFSDQLSNLPGDKDQQIKIKDSLKEIIGWIPEGTYEDRVRELNELLQECEVLLKEGNESNKIASEFYIAIEQVKGLIVASKDNHKQFLETSIKTIKTDLK